MQITSGVKAEVMRTKVPILQIDRLTKSHPSRTGDVLAVDAVTFDVGHHEFVSVVGPSGCGKTTLMMCIAGLSPTSGGQIFFQGVPVSSPPEGVGVVFQDYSRSLFPWLTCTGNVSLALRGRKLTKAEVRRRTANALEMVDLRDVGDRYPWQLSGGMQQRVAIARSLALSPTLLIMDEPFASVDAQTRASLEDLLLTLWAETQMTILFVTHDIDEAVYLADRVVVLSQGPSVVRKQIEVALPRPRDQIITKELPDFLHLRARVFGMVMESQRRSDIVEQRGR